MTVGQLKEMLESYHDDDETEIFIIQATHDHHRTMAVKPITGVQEEEVQRSDYHDSLVILQEECHTDDMKSVLVIQ